MKPWLRGTGASWHAFLWSGSAAISRCTPAPADSVSRTSTTPVVCSRWVRAPARERNHNTHALLWNGSADSYVDLNPSGFTESIASATNGVQQVGTGWRPEFGLTSGTSENFQWAVPEERAAYSSCNHFTPAALPGRTGFGIGGTQQVGYGGNVAGGADSLRCSGAALRAGSIDPNPGGFGEFLRPCDGWHPAGGLRRRFGDGLERSCVALERLCGQLRRSRCALPTSFTR